jgi:hypothetical protein
MPRGGIGRPLLVAALLRVEPPQDQHHHSLAIVDVAIGVLGCVFIHHGH